MEKDLAKNKAVANNEDSVLYYTAAAFLPCVFLFFLYNRNRVMNNLFFSHILILAALFIVISLLLFAVYKKFCKSNEGAFAALLVSWVFFWLFEAIYNIAHKYSSSLRKSVLSVVMAICIAFVIWALRRHISFLVKRRSGLLFIPILTCILFLFNVSPAVYNAITVQLRSTSEIKEYDLKSDFIVDDSLPTPDIYWLHMEESIGFTVTEKYFGDAQDELKSELTARGFILNEDAELKAGFTSVALPAMLSPTFYDNYLRQHLKEAETLFRGPRQSKLTGQFELDGINLNRDIVPSHELFVACKAADYTIIVTNPLGGRLSSPDYLYRADDELPLLTDVGEGNRNEVEAFKELADLLMMTTPLSIIEDRLLRFIDRYIDNSWVSIPEYKDDVNRISEQTYGTTYEKRIYRRLLDSFSISSPKLTYLVNRMPHSPYNKVYETGQIEHPSPNKEHAVDILYLPNYKYATKVMLITIDMILEQDPGAVIVLQGDHGIHANGHSYLVKEGYPADQILELNYSVISAVRLPAELGELKEPLDPLNISRWLVNSFVGENYEMLS